jgi:gliding motility-associated-like protein
MNRRSTASIRLSVVYDFTNIPSVRNFYLLGMLLFAATFTALGQNNLKVSYLNTASTPQNITICGGLDTVTVLISSEGNVTGTRSNISAQLALFQGVRMGSMLSVGTTPGVVLVSGANTGMPVFQLPDITPGIGSGISITMTLTAGCLTSDTIAANPSVLVFDTWNFNYDLASVALSETDLNQEYKDAIKIPFFTMGLQTATVSPVVGVSFGRTVTVNNTGINGYVSTMTYTNTQGPGVWVKTIKVNGIAVTPTKVKNISGDTIITINLTAVHFAANTVGGNLGNGNSLFEQNEQLTITEEAVLVSCAKSRVSSHKASWGCQQDECNQISKSDYIFVGEGGVNIVFGSTGLSVPKANVGYCKQGVYPARFTNNGIEIDPGTANMINVTVGLGLGNTFSLNQGSFRISSIKVAGILIDNPDTALIVLNNNPLFAIDPDGAGGLSDIDGDGFFDDMGPGAAIELIAYVDLDCSLTNAYNPSNDSNNDLDMVINGRIDHTNFCDERVSFGQSRFSSATNINDYTENCSEPDATIAGDVFHIEHFERRNVFNFDKNCNGEERFIVEVPIKAGFDYHVDQSTFTRLTLTYPLFSQEIIGDTLLRLVYSANGSTFINGDYKFILAASANCDAPLGESSFNIKLQYWCPPCDCKHTWYQQDIPGPFIHENPAGCPGVVAPCDRGLKTTAFEAIRTTLGYTDATYTTHVSPANAVLNLAASCDSIRMTVRTIVGDQPITDSIGVAITYNNVDGTDSLSQIFPFCSGTALIYHGLQIHSCPIDSTNLHVLAVDSSKTMYFDLHDCLQETGWTLLPGDSVVFQGMFTVNPNGPYKDQFLKVPNFRAYGYYIDQADTISCGSYGILYKIGKVRSIFSFPSSSSFPKGCTQTDLNYRIITVNNNYKDFFINEYRPAVKVDSVKFYFDPQLLEAFDKVEISASVPGHPTFASNYYTIHQLDSTGYFIARFDTLMAVPALNNIQSYSFALRMRLVPSCRSLFGSELGTNKFDFDPVFYYTDRYYALEYGDGSCARVAKDSVSNDITYTEPPVLNISPITNPNASPAGDTATWIVKVCNTSTKGDAKATFVHFIDSTQTVQIFEVTDITVPTTPRVLTVKPSGVPGGYFVLTDGMKIATGASTVNDICNNLRIRGTISQCVSTNFRMESGWSCTPFDTLNWNPVNYPPCGTVSFPMAVNTNGAALEASFVTNLLEDLSICDTSKMEMVVRNIDLGTSGDIDAEIFLPILGATLLDGIEIAWPSSSAFVAYPANALQGTTTTQGLLFKMEDILNNVPGLTVNGLPGFNPIAPNDSNEIRIRFNIATDCNFTGGKVIYQRFSGQSACGDSLGGVLGNSQPIYLAGVDVPAQLYDITLQENTGLTPGGTGKLGINIQNISTVASGNNEYFQIVIPDSIYYQPGSAEGNTWSPGEPIITSLDGFTILQFLMPPGLLPGATAQLTIGLTAPSVTCNGFPIEALLSTLVKTDLFCQATNTNCNVGTITSQDGDQIMVLPLYLTPFELLDDAATSVCLPSGGEQINMQLTLESLINLSAGSYIVCIFDDINGDNTLNPGESIPWIQNGNPATQIGDIINFDISFVAQPAQICRLRFMAEIPGQSCPVGTFALTPPQLLNAGNDQTICHTGSNLIAQLGASCMGDYTYVWAALSPALDGWLSSTNTGTTTLTIPASNPIYGAFQFVVTTTRGGVCSSKDTVTIIRLITFEIEPMSSITLIPGSSTVLMPMIVGGQQPFTYNWGPAAGLNNTTIYEPTVSTLVSNTYTVTVTDANNCTATASVFVNVFAELNANAIPAVSTICLGETQQFIASGGNSYKWFDYPTNPTTGLLSNYNIQNPIFSGGFAGITYKYYVVVGDSNLPGITDTATVQITVKPKLDVTVSAPTTFGCDQTLTLTANGAFIYQWMDIDDNTFYQIGVQNNFTITDSMNLYVVGLTNGYCPDTAYYEYAALPTDEEAPAFTNIPDNLQLTCGDAIPPIVNPTVTDNCDQDPDLAFVELPYSVFDCNYTITRVWTATDNAGNMAQVSQTITFEDTTPPYLTFTDPALIGLQPGDTIVGYCNNPPVINSSDAVAVDDCDGSPNISFSDIWQTVGTCQSSGYQMLMYCGWTATDACGNSTHFDFYVKIIDNVAPTFTNVPEDFFAASMDEVPTANPAEVVAIDDCDNAVTITIEETSEIIFCQNNIFRLWIATDACGNSTEHLQTIIVDGFTEAPIITPLHPMLQGITSGDTMVFDCSQILPAMGLGDVALTVNCGDNPTLLFKESVNDTLPCSETGFLKLLKCSWVATNGLGDTTIFLIYVKVVDETPPVILTQINDLFLENESQIPPATNLMVTDNCDQAPNIYYSQDSIAQGDCVTTIYRKWIVTDHCGNFSEATQHIHLLAEASSLNWNGNALNDTIITDCSSGNMQTTQIDWSATCMSSASFSNYTDTLVAGGCTYGNGVIAHYIHHWVATMTNGEMFEFTAHHLVKDLSAPTFINQPTNIMVTDANDIPAPLTLSAVDNCDNDVQVDYYQSGDSLSCNQSIYRTWIAHDDCGNISMATQTISLQCECSLNVLEDGTALMIQFDCNTPQCFCIPIMYEDLPNYTVLDNGVPYVGMTAVCGNDTLIEYDLGMLIGDGLSGPYVITNWIVNGQSFTGTFNNQLEMEDALNALDPLGQWLMWPGTNTMCGDATNGNVYGDMQVLHLSTNATVVLDPMIEIMGSGTMLEMTTGSHYLEVIDNMTGCRDTAYCKVLCVQFPVIQVLTYVTEGSYDSYCLSQLGLGNIVSVEEQCSNSSGDNVLYTYDEEFQCYYYDGLTPGTDSLCLYICLDNGLCAVVYFSTTVVPASQGGIQNLMVYEGTNGIVCLETDELTADPTSISCIQDPNMGIMSLGMNGTDCISFTANQVGSTQALFVLCDTEHCDTVLLNITVQQLAVPTPIAVDDQATTTINQEVEILPLTNDTYSELVSGTILREPQYGQVIWPNIEAAMMYKPDFEYCNDHQDDNFSYEICNNFGCDSATVFVRTLCHPLSIYNGFSPNSDGINDYFKIDGLQNYSAHRLYIYNRWGTEVYRAAPYQNDWYGTFGGKILPNGTYFYLLDTGDGRLMTGYIQLQP